MVRTIAAPAATTKNVKSKQIFRATTGLSLEEQRVVAQQLTTSGHDVLQKIQHMKKIATKQKKSTKENNLKYEWLHEHHHLKQLTETCAKELETLLLRMYNDACSDIAPPSSAPKATLSKSVQPETLDDESDNAHFIPQAAESYAREMGGLIQLEQEQSLAILQHIASQRAQRMAMQQVLECVRQSPQDSTMICKAQDLLFEAVIGHQMIEETLDQERQLCEAECKAVYNTVVASLRDRDGGEGGIETEMEKIENILDTVWRKAGADHETEQTLRLELLVEFQQLWRDLEKDIVVYEKEFVSAVVPEDGSASRETVLSKTGGWVAEDHERFSTMVKTHELKAKRAVSNDSLYAQLHAILPHLTMTVIKSHVSWYQHYRYYHEKVNERRKTYERKVQTLQQNADERIQKAVQQQKDIVEKKKEMANWQQQCSILQSKVHAWKESKEIQDRIHAQQEEIQAILLAEQRNEDQIRQRRKHEADKQLIEVYQQERQMEAMVKEMEQTQEQERLTQERAVQSIVNAERVRYRQLERNRKRDDERVEQERLQAIEIERRANLEAIKKQTPYAERVAAIVVDPERTRQETAAFRANIDAIEETAPIHEQGLFPAHGYDTDTLFKNARFRLGIALRDAGLHSTEYARTALNQIKVSNTGAYRHHVPSATQLW